MAISNMAVFNSDLRTLTVELLQQNLNAFNGSTNGAIQISADGFGGDFFEKSFTKALDSAQRRVDRYGANSAVTAIDLQDGVSRSVKIAGGFGPVRIEPSQYTWMEDNPARGMSAIATAMANAMLADFLNTALLSAVAAIGNNIDATLTSALNLSSINTTDGLFGDARDRLSVRVMDGATATKIIGDNIANANRLFTAGNVTVLDVLGKNVVVTDSPSLRVLGKARVLTLVNGGVMIGNTRDLITNVSPMTNGNERIEQTYQADYSFTLELAGYSWDDTTGGKSPIDADLGTGTNWVKNYTDVKMTAGTLLIEL